jgi:hypothetical protein
MATITAKNIGRINVWPTYAVAQDADTAESKFTGQLTVWRTNEEAKANISHEEGGGGVAPDWVPDNAVIHIDLVGGSPQGRAWVAGTGEVAVDTLLGADPNTENAWDVTEYDPGDLTVDGLVMLNDPVAFIGSVLARLLAGATIRYVLKNVVVPVIDDTLLLASADGNDALNVDTTGVTLLAYSWGGSATDTRADVLDNTLGATNAVAATISGMRLEVAANGIPDPIALTLVDLDRPAANPLVAALLVSTTKALQSITLYDPLPSTAGLSELSEI